MIDALLSLGFLFLFLLAAFYVVFTLMVEI